jgi:supervillin
MAAETVAGSSVIRHSAERKAAVETLFNFSQHEGTSGFVITSGYEPPAFKALFPYWVVQAQGSPPDSAPNSPMAEQPASPSSATTGSIPMPIPVQSALEKLTRTSFTLEELKEKPEGVDMGKLETYLCDEEFENLLQMTRPEFCRLQSWKQTELKKAVGLF